MNNGSNYLNNATEKYTGRYIVTFQENAVNEGMKLLNKSTDVQTLPTTSDFAKGGWDMEEVQSAKGLIYENLGIAVIEAEQQQIMQIQSAANPGQRSPILAIEPEMVMHATHQELNQTDINNMNMPLSYIKGCRDEIDSLYNRLVSGQSTALTSLEVQEVYNDTAQATWGLQATKAVNSRYSGRGIRVAGLGSGLDLTHPDFKGRQIVSKSFVPNETVQDNGYGSGTFYIGTACGNRSNTGLRYGVAYESEIYVGKVLSNSGSGTDTNILAGIDWAISNQCHIILMPLGSSACTTTIAYERAGLKALRKGCLIVASAGNSANRAENHFGCVSRPANSRSIMAVAALNNQLEIANFSARSGSADGGEVDIAAPGVATFSSWKMDKRYGRNSGTSMAACYVSGIAALFAEAYDARGYELWQMLITHARKLPTPSVDIGAGIVQAP